MAGNPISQEELDSIQLTADDLLVAELVQNVRDDIASRQAWEDRMNMFHRKRMGIRKPKTFPWNNASNLNIPMADKTIRRLKPGFVNLAFRASPIVSYDPVGTEDFEESQDQEKYFDWTMKTHVDDFFRSLVRGVDWMLESGFFFWKTSWDYRTQPMFEKIRRSEFTETEIQALQDPNGDIDEKLGHIAGRVGVEIDEDDLLEDILNFLANTDDDDFEYQNDEHVIADKPVVTAVKASSIFAPPDTTSIETARRLTHQLFLTKNDLAIMEADGIYSDTKHAMPVKRKELNETSHNSKEEREGVHDIGNDEELVEVWEIYSWQNIHGEGKPAVKTVMTVDPNSLTKFRYQELPFEHGEWPLVQMMFEITDDRLLSPRGIMEMLDDICTEINAQHNGKIDRMTIANAPMIILRSGSSVSGKNIRYVPGQSIRARRPKEDVVPFQFPIIDASFDNEESRLKTWGDEYIGDPALGFGSPLAQSGDKTATEVNAIEQNSQLVFSLDGRVFQDGMTKMYRQVDSNINQFGDDKIYERVMNKKPQRRTKHEQLGMFNMRATGTMSNVNPVIEAQKAQARFSQLQGHPLVNQRNLIEDYLLKDDQRVAQRLILTEDEVTQAQAQAQQSQNSPTLDEAIGGLKNAKKNGATQVRG